MYRLILEITDKEAYNGFFQISKGFLKRVIVGFNCDFTPSNVRSVLDSSGYDEIPIQIAQRGSYIKSTFIYGLFLKDSVYSI